MEALKEKARVVQPPMPIPPPPPPLLPPPKKVSNPFPFCIGTDRLRCEAGSVSGPGQLAPSPSGCRLVSFVFDLFLFRTLLRDTAVLY